MNARLVRIALALDEPLVSAGLAALLARQAEFAVYEQPGLGGALKQAVAGLRPHLLILATQTGSQPTLALAAEITRLVPRTRLVMLSHSDCADDAEAHFAIGASAFVLAGTGPDELIATLHVIIEDAGERHRLLVRPTSGDPRTSSVEHRRATLQAPADASLTPREREIVGLIATCHSTRVIAERLAVSPATIAKHRANLMRKLGVRNVAALTRYALSQGVVSCAGGAF